MEIKVISIVTRMNLGGVAMLLAELHKSLPSAEFSQTLITGECADNETDILANTSSDPNIIRIKNLGRSVNFLSDFSTFRELRKILKKIQPDIVHTHTSKAGVIGRIAARSLGKNTKIVHTFHGHHLYGYFPKIIVQTIILLERRLGNITDLLVSDSNQVMIDLKKRKIGINNKWDVIAPGIRNMIRTSRSEARLNLGIDNNLFIICWIGRFTEIKNPMLALKSLMQISHSSAIPVKLIMVGDGELLATCKDFVYTNNLQVSFPGWKAEISNYLEASDNLLMTSVNEGFGLVIAEAGFFSVPAVSTDVGGVREFIDDGKNGFIVEPTEFHIASKIIELIGEPDLLIRAGEEARKTTSKNFTAEIFVEKHRVAYKHLISPSPKSKY